MLVRKTGTAVKIGRFFILAKDAEDKALHLNSIEFDFAQAQLYQTRSAS